MAISWLQKIRLALRGWGRRREADARQRDEEFLRRNTSWAPAGRSTPAGGPAVASAAGVNGQQKISQAVPAERFDVEGLCVAYLDDSGRIAHYLDVTTGEVIDHRITAGADPFTDAARYKRVPSRSGTSESDDRAVFARGLPPSRTRSLLEQAIGLDDAAAFRRTLGDDRAAEKAWYSFKNDRAYAAVDSWLAGLVGSSRQTK